MRAKPAAREDWCGYQRKWYEANKEKILAKKRQMYERERALNSERYRRMLETVRAWFGDNPDYKKKWLKANPNYFRDWQRRRRKVLNSLK